MIFMRIVHRDIARYNQLDAEDDAQEEFGWKLIHGDVFRPPRHALSLSVFVGSGSQLLLCTTVTLGEGAFYNWNMFVKKLRKNIGYTICSNYHWCSNPYSNFAKFGEYKINIIF